ncbi:phosphate signaling complex protein PhoU [Desulfogranum japonicum]|uniref:phosphate signaling complex protein PhoU n=1 Tax=Desulfogranum japonicum TaxID=231447 RepID=UPI000406295C|nr:phosphate signaling complex protein PhoU [Desulfogranum japonicum]
MSRHMFFHREIDKLKKGILNLGGMVEVQVRNACALLGKYDEQAARELMNSDWKIDDAEIAVEEECLKVLALHQPVARDLRLIIAIIKINNELERIADIAINITKRLITIQKHTPVNFSFDYQPMAEQVLEMLKISLDALVTEDATLARKLFVMDEEVDSMRNMVYREVIAEIQGGNTAGATGLVNLYLIARHLERIGDRTNNIAEEIIYLVEGEIVRGGGEAV